jgi:hypothetical protein
MSKRDDRVRRVSTMPLLVAVLFTIALAGAVAAVAFYAVWRYLLPPVPAGGHRPASEIFDLLKIALAIAAGIGGVVALVVALRRQRISEAEHRFAAASDRRDETRLFNERFRAAAALLGDKDSAAVRMSGVHALASLADDWTTGRQSCVDVLCGYLRLPYDPDTAPPGEREVRLTILTTIGKHLLQEADPGWHNRTFDLRGAVIDGGNLNGGRLDGGVLRLARARLVGEGLSWQGGYFIDSYLDCADLELTAGGLSFDFSTFRRVRADFSRAKVTGGSLGFTGAAITIGSNLDFCSMVLDGGSIHFDRAQITASETEADRRRGALIDFSEAELTAGQLTFIETEFAYDRPRSRRGKPSTRSPQAGDWPMTLDFYQTGFRGAEVTFARANFADGAFSFAHSKIDGSRLVFDRAGFGEALVFFRFAHLIDGTLSFKDARLLREDPRNEGGGLAYLAELQALDAEQRRGFEMLGLEKPSATLDFCDARFDGGEVHFTYLHAAGGVISFAGLQLTDTTVRFTQCAIFDLLVVVWNMRTQPGTGSFQFEESRPRLLLHHTMTDENRARIVGVSWPECYEISSRD